MPRATVLSLALCAVLTLGCEDQKTSALPAGSSGAPETDASTKDAHRYVIANWNLEWFGSPTEGPTDDALQVKNVTTVMRNVDADLWALQEVASSADLAHVASDLGGYETIVADGSKIESVPGASGTTYQKLAAAFRKERFEVRAARVVLTDSFADFNGRPPLEIDLATKPAGAELTFVVVHLAAGTDADSYAKRKTESALLKAHLDAMPAGARVLVAGDFNDGLESSSYQRSETPFAALLSDPAYTFVTRGLSSPRYPRVIDHQLVTDDLLPAYVTGSAQVVDGDAIIQSNYRLTTSDHDPTRAEYTFE